MSTEQFEWTTHAEAFARVAEFVRTVADRNTFVGNLSTELSERTGTRLIDWIDRIGCESPRQFIEYGFEETMIHGETVWKHPGAMLPVVFRTDRDLLAVHVDSITDFLLANGCGDAKVVGGPFADVRRACVSLESETEFHVVQRRGTPGWEPNEDVDPTALARHAERLLLRQREFADDADGFAHCQRLIGDAIDEIGVNRTCDLFFQAERTWWQRRNHAARVQFARQQAMGLGWGNHDHHTYRSGRRPFRFLIETLELLGFECRERFYAGADAGWGAQVLEQTDCRVVIFADVDLAPDEVAGDFAHGELPDQAEPGTVGLWCALHGEAFLQAGMHHLECQFDFDKSRSQLAEAGVETMAPFTDFPHLRQAFTVGERWPVCAKRLAAARAAGFITDADVARFTAEGALGSHLEILERNDGYKGFNKTGISDIILETNPRAN